jgi:hypothetical protein
MHHIINTNGNLLLSRDYFLSRGISENYLRVAKCRSAKVGYEDASWKFENINGITYFSYSNLPAVTAAKIEPYRELEQRATNIPGRAEQLVIEAVSSGFKEFLKYTIKTPDEKVNEQLAISMCVIAQACKYVKENGISFRKSQFFRELVNEVKLESLKYLPIYWRNMRDRIKRYSKGEDISNIQRLKNIGNQYGSLLKDKEKADIILPRLLELAQDPRNYSGACIWRKLRTYCEEKGIKAPSKRWVTRYLAKPQTQGLIAHKYGRGRFGHK